MTLSDMYLLVYDSSVDSEKYMTNPWSTTEMIHVMCQFKIMNNTRLNVLLIDSYCLVFCSICPLYIYEGSQIKTIHIDRLTAKSWIFIPDPLSVDSIFIMQGNMELCRQVMNYQSMKVYVNGERCVSCLY